MEPRLIKGEYRLYCYDGNGNIRKVGKYKTDRKKYQQHFFDSESDAMTYIEVLIEAKRYGRDTQFLIIEYFPVENEGKQSRIVGIMNT
jgi:hypothetical protein